MMSKDRPIKSFRLEGERPFKTYNPGISSMLFANSRRQEHPHSLPTTASSLPQQQLYQRQQQRHILSTQLNQPPQQTYDPGEYFRISTQQQQSHQSTLLSSDLASYDYDDDLDEPSNNLKRSDLMASSASPIPQGELNLNISNVVSSHSGLPNFMVPNRSIFRTAAGGYFADQDPISLLFDNPTTMLGSGLSESMDNPSPVTVSSLINCQLPQHMPTPFPTMGARTSGSIRPGATSTFSTNKDNFPVKQEVHKGRFHVNETTHTSMTPTKQNGESFSDSFKHNRNDFVSGYSKSSTETFQNKASTSRIYQNTSNEESSTEEHSVDPAYLEKRRKNNESAKRSREARRTKEELVALRVIGLEEENMRLRAEICLLDKELDELRTRLYQCN